MAPKQPWKPADATDEIRKLGRSPELKITYKGHASDQMRERGLIVGDILYILKNGFVYSDPESATQRGLWKYAIESRTPNSGNRVVRTIVIPDPSRVWVKFVTVMWADE